MEEEGALSKSVAVVACTDMTVFYVAILYSSTLILRLPPPSSFKSFMIRQFICAGVFSVIFCALILPIRRWETSSLFGVYGIRLDRLFCGMPKRTRTDVGYSCLFCSISLKSLVCGSRGLKVEDVDMAELFSFARECRVSNPFCCSRVDQGSERFSRRPRFRCSKGQTNILSPFECLRAMSAALSRILKHKQREV